MAVEGKPNSTRNKVFDWFYFALLLALPLCYVGTLVDPVLLPRQLLLSGFVGTMAFLIYFQIRQKTLVPSLEFLKSGAILSFSLLLWLVLLSFRQAIVLSESIYVFAKLSLAFAFLLVTVLVLVNEKLSRETLAKAVVVMSGIVISVALFQVVKLSGSKVGLFKQLHEITSVAANKNLMASLLFLMLPFQILTMNYSKSWRYASLLLIVLGVLLTWLVQTRATLLAYIVFLGIYVLGRFWLNKAKQKQGSSWSLLALLGFAFAGLSASTYLNKEKFSRLFNLESVTERLALWHNSVELVKEHPLSGVGAGNWQVNYLKYGLNHFPVEAVRTGMTTFQRPHNDFLWVLCETGILGLLAYAAIFGFIIFYCIKLIRTNKGSAEGEFYLSIFATLLGYIAIALLDFPLERIEHQVLLMLLFAVVIAANFKTKTEPEWSDSLRLYANLRMAALFIIAGFSGYVATKRIVGEYHSHRLFGFHSRGNWPAMMREVDKAKSPLYSIDPMSIPLAWYSGVALFSEGKIQEGNQAFEQAYALAPYNIHVLNNLASSYEKLGNHEKAILYYKQALSISVGMEESLLNLAAVYFNQKEYRQAFEQINQCNVDCKDPKYQTFLPVILNAYLDLLITEEKQPQQLAKLQAIKSSPKPLAEYYFESKKKGINFDTYLNQIL